ncbi:MAG: hypothetical protein PVF51_14210 [Nitrospirota bacterium]|jgi:hypothetical protein
MMTVLYRFLVSFSVLLGTAGVLHAAVPAPDFTLRTYAGDRYHLRESRGKEVVVLFAWASW